MKTRELHVVIGGGVAGSLSALLRSRAGYDVLLLEKQTARALDSYPVCTQTSNIVSENHSGAEYPFDPQSARDCLDGRIENEKLFPAVIYGGKTYSRIIASQSMMDAGHDIVGQCRKNMEVIRSHYAQYWAKDPAAAVFGHPSEICREVPGVEGVRDVAAAFITPQRGINPVLVSSVLEYELKRNQVDFRQGSVVSGLSRLADGRYSVTFESSEGRPETVVADQVSLCAATSSFRMARELNPALEFPRIFMALRTILYVSLPDGCDKNFTCLKLEDEYGGMLSPLSNDCAMIYHPPSAHIMNIEMDAGSCAFPQEYAGYLAHGHPELEARSRQALDKLRAYYGELRRSEILGMYLKVAINTVTDSRVRRNLGVYQVVPGCTMSVLPKWTMGAVNAKRELRMALEHSRRQGNLEVEEVESVAAHASRMIEAPVEWRENGEALRAYARRHALNMGVPEQLAAGIRPREGAAVSGMAGSAA